MTPEQVIDNTSGEQYPEPNGAEIVAALTAAGYTIVRVPDACRVLDRICKSLPKHHASLDCVAVANVTLALLRGEA
jgi:hypothetical protein